MKFKSTVLMIRIHYVVRFRDLLLACNYCMTFSCECEIKPHVIMAHKWGGGGGGGGGAWEQG